VARARTIADAAAGTGAGALLVGVGVRVDVDTIADLRRDRAGLAGAATEIVATDAVDAEPGRALRVAGAGRAESLLGRGHARAGGVADAVGSVGLRTADLHRRELAGRIRGRAVAGAAADAVAEALALRVGAGDDRLALAERAILVAGLADARAVSVAAPRVAAHVRQALIVVGALVALRLVGEAIRVLCVLRLHAGASREEKDGAEAQHFRSHRFLPCYVAFMAGTGPAQHARISCTTLERATTGILLYSSRLRLSCVELFFPNFLAFELSNN